MQIVYLTVVNVLFALKELQAHIGCTQVATYAYQVGILGTIAVHNLLLGSLANTGDADGHACERRGGVATNHIYIPLIAGQAQSAVELLDILDTETLADGERNGELTGCAVHGEDIADVYHGRLVAQVLEVDISKVEVYALHQHIGGNEYLLIGVAEYGAIIANTFYGAGVLDFDILC